MSEQIERTPASPKLVWPAVLLLVAVVVVFAALRVATDVPNIAAGRLPDAGSFEYRYARYPWLAYAHLVPGVIYLLLAPIQLWRGFRTRHYEWHRRVGRVALAAGLVAGVVGIVFGLLFSFGGVVQASASVVFGTWFVVALARAYRAIRRGDRRAHRRWMIRAFAIGLAVGTIRAWIGLFQALGVLSFQDAFGVAFWLSFTLHFVAAELWLRWRPWPGETERGARAVAGARGAPIR
jgi:uncharacterized membrane protein YozB (DUF420 family)